MQVARAADGALSAEVGAHRDLVVRHDRPTVVVRAGSGRDTSIDILRGLAIASMVIAHMAGGSVIYTVTHAPLWIDAAFLFVTLSGLVLGIVQRRALEKTGAVGVRKLLRRAFMLYVIQFCVLVLALWTRTWASRPADLPTPEARGGWPSALGEALTLQLPAPNLTILPMYVVLLGLVAVAAVLLLRSGRVRVLLALSLSLYVVSFLAPSATVLPSLLEDDLPQFNWAGWQFPFVVCFVVGWFWRERGLRETLLSRAVVGGSAAVWLVCFGVAQLFARLEVTSGTTLARGVTRTFEKFDLGPGTLVYGAATLVLGYALVSAANARPGVAGKLEPLRLLGSRSLDSFVILCIALVLLPALLGYSPEGVAGMSSALAVLVVAWAWALGRARWKVRAPGGRSARRAKHGVRLRMPPQRPGS